MKTKCIPILHPAAVLRQWSDRSTTVSDLRRCARFRNNVPYPKPDWKFTIRPTFQQACITLEYIYDILEKAKAAGTKHRLSFDYETRNGHISCAGISWTLLDAICIPFYTIGRPYNYWSEEEELILVIYLTAILTHISAFVVGQNILYDSQYSWRWWFFVPNIGQDCMISQHTLFSDKPKALGYQASLYCNYYVYWKDEGKDWDPKIGEEQLWYYNCEDCVYTDECGRVELQLIKHFGLTAVHDFQQSMLFPVLEAMKTGVNIDTKRRSELIDEVRHEVKRREDFLLDILGHSLNPDSPKQMHALFYEDLKLPVQLKRGKAGEPAKPTLDDDALQKLVVKEPLIKFLVTAIADIRTLRKFLSNFLTRPLDVDGRMRTAYNIGGSESGKSAPKTFRLSSSENAFGSGANLQNIPGEKSKSVGKSAARGGIPALGDPYQFPNIRSIFTPDPEHTFFDLDLQRADLFVVAYEAGDRQLIAAMHLGVDIHLLNAFVVTGREPPPLDELVESHPKYNDHRRPLKLVREFAKVFCHGTNYGGQPATMAKHTGRTVAEVDRAQKIWFGAHPGIEKWHLETKKEITAKRYVENRFGYRWYIFDRIDSILPEAIAWRPQSTVAIVINRIWRNIHETLPQAKILLQTHDSLSGQYLTRHHSEVVGRLSTCAEVVVPYEQPLIIPFSFHTSQKSWGDC